MINDPDLDSAGPRQPVGGFLSGLPACLSARWRSGLLRDLVLGAPALVGLAVVGLAVVRTAAGRDGSLANAYVAEGQRQLQCNRYGAAHVCYQRLMGWNPLDPDYRLGLARAEAGLGRVHAAASLLRELAPPDRPGYAPAQFEVARRLLSQSPGPGTLAEARLHLVQGLRNKPEDPEGNALMARSHLADGRLGPAEPFLARAAGQRPDLLIPWAGSLTALGRHRDARKAAEAALVHFARSAEASVSDHLSRFRAAEAAVFLGDHERAVGLLQRGLELTGDPNYRPALAKVYVAWADSVCSEAQAERERDSGKSLVLLERGLLHDPTNANLLKRFVAMLRRDRPDAGPARSTLQARLVRGEAGAGVHFALAVDAQKNGNPRSTRLHLEQAIRLAPELKTLVDQPGWDLPYH